MKLYAVLLLSLCTLLPSTESRLLAFVANSSHVSSYVVNFDGSLDVLNAHQNIASSAWISVYPTTNPFLLLATGTAPDGNGTVYLYNINRNNGVLTRRSEQNSSGLNPAYASFNPAGNLALVANYGQGDDNSTGASIVTIPINQSSQSFSRPASVILHYGSGPNVDRQTGPHPHMVATDYTGQFAFSTDLGLDDIFQYQVLPNGSLVNNTLGSYVNSDMPGAGPRHFAFHPNRLFVYVVNEMLNTVNVFLYDSTKGALSGPVQSVSTLPQGYSGSSEAAEIAVTPDGRFLYVSNRGYDSIVGYYVDPTQTDFNLKRIDWTTHRISTPRNFAIDPTGRLLLVGCSTTNEVVAFTIQPDGALAPTGGVTSIAGAISIVLSESN